MLILERSRFGCDLWRRNGAGCGDGFVPARGIAGLASNSLRTTLASDWSLTRDPRGLVLSSSFTVVRDVSSASVSSGPKRAPFSAAESVRKSGATSESEPVQEHEVKPRLLVKQR